MNISGIEAIRLRGKPYMAVPKTVYRHMMDALEDAEDVLAVRDALEALSSGEEETFPAEFAFALARAKHPGKRVALWRKQRGYNRAELARKVGVTGQFISLIESGDRKGDIGLYRKLADALICDIDDLV